MYSISSGERAIAKLASILALFAFLPGEVAAQGQPVETGSHLPVAMWFIGAGVLGLVLAYGIRLICFHSTGGFCLFRNGSAASSWPLRLLKNISAISPHPTRREKKVPSPSAIQP
jgi:hypothetical protein